MLAATHAMMAFNQGWNIVTQSRQVWIDFLASQRYPTMKQRGYTDEQPISGILYDTFVADGVIDLASPLPQAPVDIGVVMGRAKAVRVYVAGANTKLINETLGQNFDATAVAGDDESATITI